MKKSICILCGTAVAMTASAAPAAKAASAASAAKAATAAKARPNVIIIITDDQGYGDLSCMYARDMQTPNIDGLFSDGVRMDNYYSNSALSSPARAALLTGCNSDMAGVQGVIRNEDPNSYYENFGHLNPKYTILPQLLKKNGYTTALIGKWHLGYASPNTPNDRGFDLFRGIMGGMMDDYYTHTRKGYPALWLNKTIAPPVKGHITDVLTDYAIDFVRQSGKSEKPFFLYLAYNAPHIPLDAPKDWVERVKQRQPGITDTRARLVTLIEQIDAGVGRLVEELKRSGQWENTFIMYSSDNGGYMQSQANNGPYRGYKATMYEGGLRVPAAFFLKGRIEKGRSTNMAQHMDIVPTLCDLLKIPVTQLPQQVEGISILPTLEGRAQTTDDRYFWFMEREANEKGNKLQTAIRHGNFKLVQNMPAEPYELFDLASDPKETTSLPLSGDIYKDLYFQMRVHIANAGAVPWNVPKDEYVYWPDMVEKAGGKKVAE